MARSQDIARPSERLRETQSEPENTVSGWQTKDDGALLASIAEGSHHAFSVLVERHATRFYAVAYRFVRSRAEAEDIVQDAFLKLWEKPGLWQADKQAKFTTWFYRVVVNLCLDRQKKKAPLPMPEHVDFADDTPRQDDMLAAREAQQMLEAAMDRLPERQRTALNLCFYEGLSNQEAADIMGVKLKALQSLLMRAKMTLKDECSKRGMT